MYVPKHFIMDPETDDLLIDGHMLQNGMVVLLAEDGQRSVIDTYTQQPKTEGMVGADFVVNLAKKNNCWSKIHNIRRSEHVVTFVGEYIFDGGYKMLHKVDLNEAWYVKKSSVHEEYLPDDYSLGFKRGKNFMKQKFDRENKKELEAQYAKGFMAGAMFSSVTKQTEVSVPPKEYTKFDATLIEREVVGDPDLPSIHNILNEYPNLKRYGVDYNTQDSKLRFKDMTKIKPLVTKIKPLVTETDQEKS